MADGTGLYAIDYQYQQYYLYQPQTPTEFLYYSDPETLSYAQQYQHVQDQYYYPQVYSSVTTPNAFPVPPLTSAQPQIQHLRDLLSTFDAKVDRLLLLAEHFTNSVHMFESKDEYEKKVEVTSTGGSSAAPQSEVVLQDGEVVSLQHYEGILAMDMCEVNGDVVMTSNDETVYVNGSEGNLIIKENGKVAGKSEGNLMTSNDETIYAIVAEIKTGELEFVRKMFDEMPKRSLVYLKGEMVEAKGLLNPPWWIPWTVYLKMEDLFITSKLWSTDHAPKYVRRALDQTLQDLQIDYVDLYLIHWPVWMKKRVVDFKPENLIPTDIPITWRAMEALFDSGKARAIRVSNFSTKKMADLSEVTRVTPIECHPSWQQQKLWEFCNSNGVHLTAYSPLGSPGTFLESEVLKHPVIALTTEKLGKTRAQVALRRGLQKGHSMLPKSTTESRIKENFDVFVWSVPDELFAKFFEIEKARLRTFVQELGKWEPEAQTAFAPYTLNQIQPRVVSFEEQVLLIREKLAELHESEQQWSKAAQMLSGIDLDSGMRVIDDTFRLSKCVQIDGDKGDNFKSGRPLHDKRMFFHRIIKGFLAQGGDLLRRDGNYGESIYGGKFADEFPKLKHDSYGLLSKAIADRDARGFLFNITFKADHHLDTKCIVLGKLVHGHGVLSSWRDYCQKVKESALYQAVASNISSSTPKDWFKDAIEQEFVDSYLGMNLEDKVLSNGRGNVTTPRVQLVITGIG